MLPELVGVGHICQDYLCVVDYYPPEDGSTRILDVEVQGGGAAATALVAASRLGITSALIGTLGTDGTGDEIVAELRRESVDVTCIERLAEVTSLFSYVMIDPGAGTRTKFPFKDRMPPLAWSEDQVRMLCSAKVLHLDGTHYENALSAVRLAKQNGVTISLDGSTRQKSNELNKALASLADILITNNEYPRLVSGRPSLQEALLEMSTWGPTIVIATAGSEGAYAVIDGTVRHFDAFQAQVIDTTGAGDVFHGAFLAAFLRGKDLPNCIQFAQYAAARKCEQIGGRKGIPNFPTVEEGYVSPPSTSNLKALRKEEPK